MKYNICLGFLAIAALFDLSYRKIPNAVFLLYLPLGVLLLEKFLITLVLACAALYILYGLRFVGAGDVKLMAMLVGMLGLREGSQVIFMGWVCLAVYALFYLCITGSFFERMACFYRYIKRCIRNKKPEKYEGFQAASFVMPMAPGLALGFVLWRLMV